MKIYGNIKDSKSLQYNEQVANEARLNKEANERVESKSSVCASTEEEEKKNEAETKAQKKRAKKDKA